MSTEDKEALAVFSLVFALTDEERRPTFSDLKRRGFDRAVRDGLKQRGLIDEEKVGRASVVSLSEKGWTWALEHLDHKLPRRSYHGNEVLGRLLKLLKRHLGSRSMGLAELVRSEPPQTDQSDSNDVASRIIDASLALASGRNKVRVRLADVRRELSDIGRTELDRELMELQRQERLVLYRIDDPTDIRPEDEKAALFVAGNPRHILYVEH